MRFIKSVFLVCVLAATFVAGATAETSGQNGVDPQALSASYSFGQYMPAWAFVPGDGDSYILFGGRGGDYLGTSDRWYTGGGGRGGFSLTGASGGLGYGFFQVGHRGPVSDNDIGVDLYGGLGGGSYGSSDEMGLLAGPVTGVTAFFGAGKSWGIGVFAEGLWNVAKIDRSPVSVGLHIGGKGGSVSIPWENRETAGLD